MKTRPLTAASALVGAATLLFALASPLSASAHVTLTPATAKPGSYALVTFKVPNESATATTDRIEIDLPTATPFTSVSYVPLAGWDATLVTTTLPKPVKLDGNTLSKAVTKVIFVAQPGHQISAGQLQLFSLSLGAVPNTGKVVMPTSQGYSDGSVVTWSGTAVDADHPAPILYVNDAPVASHDADAEVTASVTDDSSAASGSPDVLARILGFGGIVVGAIAITLAALALRRKGNAL